MCHRNSLTVLAVVAFGLFALNTIAPAAQGQKGPPDQQPGKKGPPEQGPGQKAPGMPITATTTSTDAKGVTTTLTKTTVGKMSITTVTVTTPEGVTTTMTTTGPVPPEFLKKKDEPKFEFPKKMDEPKKKEEPKKKDEPKKPDEPKKVNSATVPTPFNPKRHEGFVEIAKKGNIDVLLMGDSITDGWRNAGKAVFEKHFVPLKTANFGIGGDRTQGVLWRMENGELEGYTPKLMMLMIGTNNIGFAGKGNTPEEIAEGIKAVVDKFRGKFPKAKVLLLGVFPRNVDPKSAQRVAVNNINKIISKLDDGKFVRYMDIGDKFLDKDGTLPKTVMPDALHPNLRGYEIWAEAVMPTVHEMLGLRE